MSESDTRLEALFGGQSDDAFGSAVFGTTLSPAGHLEALARDVYREFTVELWDRFGADAWPFTWSELASRSSPAAGSVLVHLRSFADQATRSAACMLVDAGPDAQSARTALVACFR